MWWKIFDLDPNKILFLWRTHDLKLCIDAIYFAKTEDSDAF